MIGQIILIAVLCVIAVIVATTRKREESKQNENQYVVRFPSAFFWILFVLLGVMLYCLFLAVPIAAHDENTKMILWVLIVPLMIFAGIALVIVSPEFQRITVDHDDITVTRFFAKHKHFKFSDITHYQQTTFGAFKIYISSQKKPVVSVNESLVGGKRFIQQVKGESMHGEGTTEEKSKKGWIISVAVAAAIFVIINVWGARAPEMSLDEFATSYKAIAEEEGWWGQYPEEQEEDVVAKGDALVYKNTFKNLNSADLSPEDLEELEQDLEDIINEDIEAWNYVLMTAKKTTGIENIVLRIECYTSDGELITSVEYK